MIPTASLLLSAREERASLICYYQRSMLTLWPPTVMGEAMLCTPVLCPLQRAVQPARYSVVLKLLLNDLGKIKGLCRLESGL